MRPFLCQRSHAKRDFHEPLSNRALLPYVSPPGTYGGALVEQQQDRPTCSGLCAAGFYQDSSGGTACKLCEYGAFCAEGSSTARLCESGRYGNATDLSSASDCVECGAGTACPVGSRAPNVCAAGSYAPPASAACTRCAAGSFQPLVGQVQCELCPAGSYCLEGATAAIGCAKGSSTALNGSATCESCTRGTFQDA